MILTADEAIALVAEHLGNSSRARHSLFVGFVMGRLAQLLDHDPGVWEVVGLCHDLDYEKTTNDRSRHGLLAASWLQGRLPPEALAAIEAHDHRTGVVSETPIAAALKLADVLAVIGAELGDRTAGALSASDAIAAVERKFPARPYVARMLMENAGRLSIDLNALAEIYRAAPPPE